MTFKVALHTQTPRSHCKMETQGKDIIMAVKKKGRRAGMGEGRNMLFAKKNWRFTAGICLKMKEAGLPLKNT